MFGVVDKLKSKFGNSAVEKVQQQIEAKVKPYIKSFTDLTPADLNNDAVFYSKVISPAKTSVELSTSGATKLVPKFDDKFKNMMLKARNELVIISDSKVTLVEGFEGKIGTVVKTGFTC